MVYVKIKKKNKNKKKKKKKIYIYRSLWTRICFFLSASPSSLIFRDTFVV